MSAEIPSDCVYDVWGADFGEQAGARCLNSDSAHQAAHHGGPETEDGEPVRAPWRFDVPEVPASVTAIQDRVGWIWVREGAGWKLWRGSPGTGPYRLYGGDLLGRAPLVECEDPRATS